MSFLSFFLFYSFIPLFFYSLFLILPLWSFYPPPPPAVSLRPRLLLFLISSTLPPPPSCISSPSPTLPSSFLTLQSSSTNLQQPFPIHPSSGFRGTFYRNRLPRPLTDTATPKYTNISLQDIFNQSHRHPLPRNRVAGISIRHSTSFASCILYSKIYQDTQRLPCLALPCDRVRKLSLDPLYPPGETHWPTWGLLLLLHPTRGFSLVIIYRPLPACLFHPGVSHLDTPTTDSHRHLTQRTPQRLDLFVS